MAAALPLVVLFAARQRARERQGREPLIRPGLLRGRAMPVGLLVMLIFYCGMGAFFVLTLHLQDAHASGGRLGGALRRHGRTAPSSRPRQ
jgi:hypothetical protein